MLRARAGGTRAPAPLLPSPVTDGVRSSIVQRPRLVLLRRCVTPARMHRHVDEDADTDTTTFENPLAKLLGFLSNTLNQAARDAYGAAYPILAIGIGMAMVLGLLWIVFLRFCAGCLIWSTIAGFILFLGGFAA